MKLGFWAYICATVYTNCGSGSEPFGLPRGHTTLPLLGIMLYFSYNGTIKGTNRSNGFILVLSTAGNNIVGQSETGLNFSCPAYSRTKYRPQTLNPKSNGPLNPTRELSTWRIWGLGKLGYKYLNWGYK